MNLASSAAVAALALHAGTPRATSDLLWLHRRAESVRARSRMRTSTVSGHAFPFAGLHLSADHEHSTSSDLVSAQPHLDIAPILFFVPLELSGGEPEVRRDAPAGTEAGEVADLGGERKGRDELDALEALEGPDDAGQRGGPGKPVRLVQERPVLLVRRLGCADRRPERCLGSGIAEVDAAQPCPECVAPGLPERASGGPLVPYHAVAAQEREHMLERTGALGLQVVERVRQLAHPLDLAGRHPYLLQLACHGQPREPRRIVPVVLPRPGIRRCRHLERRYRHDGDAAGREPAGRHESGAACLVDAQGRRRES